MGFDSWRLFTYLVLLHGIRQLQAFSALSPSQGSSKGLQEEEGRGAYLGQSSSFAALPEPTGSRNGVSQGSTSLPGTAIVLNTNARSVSEDLVPIAESIFGKDHVYVTTNEEEGKRAAAQLLQQNVSMVIPVGGDGTLSSMVNFLCDTIRDTYPFLTVEEAMKELPYVAYLPMGTGNGVGSVVGSDFLSSGAPWKIWRSKRRKLRHIQTILESFHDIGQKLKDDPNYLTHDANAPDMVELPMMQVSYSDADTRQDDTLCFFAGAGFDSLMLQDFQHIKKWAVRTKILTKSLSSVAGYCVALVLKTLPKCVARQEHNIHVILKTRDPDTLWVDHRRGDVVQSVGPPKQENPYSHLEDDNNIGQKEGTLLYQGTTGILAAATTPFYGGGLRLFPFARMTKDKMHLRLGRIHPMKGFFNIPRIFEGSYRDKSMSSFGCLDYIGGDFDIHVTSSTTDSTTNEPVKGFPVQHSGESVGYFEKFRLRVVKEPVKFVTLMKKRVVYEEPMESQQ